MLVINCRVMKYLYTESHTQNEIFDRSISIVFLFLHGQH